VVEATLRRIVHRPALVEYRLPGARVVDRPER